MVGTIPRSASMGGRWVPEPVTGMPGFGAIPEEDVLHWLGPIGARLPTVDRPTVVFVDRGVSVRAGNSITALLLATGGVPPYAFRLLTERPTRG